MISIYANQSEPSLMGAQTKCGEYHLSIKKNGHGGEIKLSREQIKSLIADLVASL